MSTITEIQAAITKLPEQEQRQLSRWLGELFADAWDVQIEEDVKAGRLDNLIVQAELDITAGRTRPLDEVLDNL
jgi:hypothetical protein